MAERPRSAVRILEQGVIGREPNYVAPNQVQQDVSDLMARAIERLFVNLKRIFPAWKSAFESDDEYAETKALWLETLAENHISLEQLKAGLEQAKLSESPFFPSVGLFMKWCKQGYNPHGLPTEDQLYHRIVAFMAYGMEEIDRFKFANDVERYLITGLYCKERANQWTDKDLRSEIQQELNRTAKRLDVGWQAPKPQPALPEKVIIPASKEQVSQHIANMKAMLNGKVISQTVRVN
ncbi:replication protein P [Lonepinella sp. BR2930]|uniref:replication protein P n=1 Tax=unclassified Lonepinella TaxID=2642006 RepID=UPI003F6E3E03